MTNAHLKTIKQTEKLLKQKSSVRVITVTVKETDLSLIWYTDLSLKPRLHQGIMLPGNMLLVAVNKIVVSLLPVCCWIQRDTCCRDTGNILPATSNMLPGNMLLVAGQHVALV